MDEGFQNLIIFGAKFWFFKLKKSRNLLIFGTVKFWKFVNFPTWKIPKNLEVGKILEIF